MESSLSASYPGPLSILEPFMNARPLVPIVLEGELVVLEPLSGDHHDGLCKVGLHPSIWTWSSTAIVSPGDMKAYMDTALQWQSEGTALPFAIIDKKSGAVVGSTRFANIDSENRRLEIGWTWLGVASQRTGINTETKYLLLSHAFEKRRCIRVEFKADVLNERSRAAILRLGAKEEGIFRKHMVMPTGRVRDTIWFSIIDTEWPRVKGELERRMDASKRK